MAKPVGKALDLKVTVVCADASPDAVLSRMARDRLRLTAPPYTLKVTAVERADGQPFGAESEFEEWWRDSHHEGDGDEETDEKVWAREAFNYAVTYMKRKESK